MDEIHDTPVDRAAMGLLLRSYPDTSVDPERASASLLNEVWARMARDLAAKPDRDFDEVEARMQEMRRREAGELEARQAKFRKAAFPDREPKIAAIDRALDLLGLVVEWRAESFAAAEIAAGRDPCVPLDAAETWQPPAGWTPPAKT
jgi:hypothetical protein